MKRTWQRSVLVGLLVVVFILVAACAPKAEEPVEPVEPVEPAPEPIVLKAVTIFPMQYAIMKGLQFYIDKVNAQTGGELVIEYLGGPEVIPELDQTIAISTGAIDISLTDGGYYYDRIPEMSAHILSTYLPQEERERGYYDYMVGLHKRQMNAMYLAHTYNNVFFYVYTIDSVETSEDLVGLRIGGGDWEAPLIEAIGAIPTAIPGEDKYLALESGLIEGHLGVIDVTYDYGVHKLAPYMVDSPYWGASGGVILMNLDRFEALPAHLRKLLLEVAEENEAEFVDYISDIALDRLNLMKEEGLQVVTLKDNPTYVTDRANESGWEYAKEIAPDSYDILRAFLAGGTFTRPLFEY